MESIETKELSVLKGQVTKLEQQASAVIITTPEENASAMNLKAKLKETGKAIKERKEEITKPLNAALKSARELFAPIEASFEAADRFLATKLLAYKQQVEAAARAEEAKIAAKVEAGKMKIETAEKKLEKVEHIEKTTHTTHGDVQFRKIKKVRVTDESKVPDKYWVLDMVAVRRDALAGELTAGVEVYEEEIV